MQGLMGLAPEMTLSLGGLLILLGDSAFPRQPQLWLKAAATFVLIAAAAVLAFGNAGVTVFGMAREDPLSVFLKIALLGGVFIVILLSFDYTELKGAPTGLYASTLLFSTVGLLLLVSATDLLLILVAFELLGIGSFVLTGFFPKRLKSSEAAIKFFLIGSLSTALLIFGLSYYYGIFGTTELSAMQSEKLAPSLPLLLALLFILAGLGFKLAMVPFHMWVPDTYEGAPTPITAFLSVAPKAAALGVLLRVFPKHSQLALSPLLAALAALTMTVGNLGAVRQTNIKRLLAYSSIAQVGYVLVGFVSAGPLGLSSALVYVVAYLFMNLGAFACVIAVSNSQGSDELSAYDGMSTKALPLSLTFVVFLLSLTGIPPLFGFVGKFSVFGAAISTGWLWLAALGVLNSVISLYYYFRIVHRMYFAAATNMRSVALSPGLMGSLALCLIVTIGFGLAPNSVLALAQSIFR